MIVTLGTVQRAVAGEVPTPVPRGSKKAKTAQRLRSFDLCADRGIGRLKRRLRVRRGTSANVNEREHGEETANHSPKFGHRNAPRPQPTMRISREFATHHANINRFVPAFLDKLEQKGNSSAWTNGTASPTTHQLED
jgi:hypothetical protein